MIRDKRHDSRAVKAIVLAGIWVFCFGALAQAEVVWKGSPTCLGGACADGMCLDVIPPHVDIELPTGSNAYYCHPGIPEVHWLDDTYDSGLSSWLTADRLNTIGQGKDRSRVVGPAGSDTLVVDTRARLWDPQDGNLFNNNGDNSAHGFGFAELWDEVTIVPDGPGPGGDVDAILSVHAYLAGYVDPDFPQAHMLCHEGTVSLPVDTLGSLYISCQGSAEGGFGAQGTQSARGEFTVLWDDVAKAGGSVQLAHAEDSLCMCVWGDLSLDELGPWSGPGPEGQWYEHVLGGFPSWYGGIICELSLPPGYHYVPEPSSAVLLALGSVSLVALRQRRRA